MTNGGFVFSGRMTVKAIAEGVAMMHTPPIHRARSSQTFRRGADGFSDADIVIPI
jgi:hypothetical protein